MNLSLIRTLPDSCPCRVKTHLVRHSFDTLTRNYSEPVYNPDGFIHLFSSSDWETVVERPTGWGCVELLQKCFLTQSFGTDKDFNNFPLGEKVKWWTDEERDILHLSAELRDSSYCRRWRPPEFVLLLLNILPQLHYRELNCYQCFSTEVFLWCLLIEHWQCERLSGQTNKGSLSGCL